VRVRELAVLDDGDRGGRDAGLFKDLLRDSADAGL
jgi:hypothetical protein